jgi:NAD(P)-dependent dehydrogenase (short-subunit alcohol dehydrogenase family)
MNSSSMEQLPGIAQFRLDGRTAIVTGGSKGLGLAMAAGLASAGAKVMLVSRRGPEAAAVAERLASSFGTDACGHAADVTDGEHVERVVQAALERWQRIDILINNAGINIRGPIDQLEETQFDDVLRTNVRGVWLMARGVVPAMKQAGYGRIINIASTLGVVGLANRTPYASSKGAVVQMTRVLGLELAPFGITCNAICPGPFLTEMNVPIADTEEAKVSILGATAMKRWGELKEIQGAAIYLASAASSYTTGSLLTVDGGWTAQ